MLVLLGYLLDSFSLFIPDPFGDTGWVYQYILEIIVEIFENLFEFVKIIFVKVRVLRSELLVQVKYKEALFLRPVQTWDCSARKTIVLIECQY
jgi:hypothetical protein